MGCGWQRQLVLPVTHTLHLRQTNWSRTWNRTWIRRHKAAAYGKSTGAFAQPFLGLLMDKNGLLKRNGSNQALCKPGIFVFVVGLCRSCHRCPVSHAAKTSPPMRQGLFRNYTPYPERPPASSPGRASPPCSACPNSTCALMRIKKARLAPCLNVFFRGFTRLPRESQASLRSTPEHKCPNSQQRNRNHIEHGACLEHIALKEFACSVHDGIGWRSHWQHESA